MKKIVSIALCLMIVISLVACGGGDALKGTWTCQDNDYGTVVWEFNGSGKCSMSNDFFDAAGTYSIVDGSLLACRQSFHGRAPLSFPEYRHCRPSPVTEK